MSSTTIPDAPFEFNKRATADFNGGNLSTDGGLILIREFMEKIGFCTLLEDAMAHIDDSSTARIHTDADIVEQIVLHRCAGHLADSDAHKLRHDPLLQVLMDKEQLASQPTLSRFWLRADVRTLDAVESLTHELQRKVDTLAPAKEIVVDLDTTLVGTHGKQEGAKYNHHYSEMGYHPFVAFDGGTGDLLDQELREGSRYCSNGAGEFMRNLLQKLKKSMPEAKLVFRGDSGFAAPEVYEALEEAECGYAIKLKDNPRLHKDSRYWNVAKKVYADMDISKEVVAYGEIEYQAKSWSKSRRVVFCIRRPKGTMFLDAQFIVTTRKDLTPEQTFDWYRGRGNAENYIKEFKNEFVHSLPHKTMEQNAVHFAIQALCYNLFNWFRRICLSGKLQKATAATIRERLIRFAVRVSRSARYVHLHLSSNSPYQSYYEQALQAVSGLAGL